MKARGDIAVFWALVCLLLGVLPAGAAPAVVRDPVYRHLFVVDTSFSMGSRSERVRESIYELVRSGCQGTMRPGDPFGIWTFAEEMETAGFVRLHWDPPLNQLFANKAYQFLSQLDYRKQTRVDRAMIHLLALFREADDLTVYLYTDGEEALSGTPFDAQIRTEFERRRRELRRARMPFVTVLRVRDGEVVLASVFAADKLVVPALDPAPTAAPKPPPLAFAGEAAGTPPVRPARTTPVLPPQPAVPAPAATTAAPVVSLNSAPMPEPAPIAAPGGGPPAQAVEVARTPPPAIDAAQPSPVLTAPTPAATAPLVVKPVATAAANSVPPALPTPTPQVLTPRVVADPVPSQVQAPPAADSPSDSQPVTADPARTPPPPPAPVDDAGDKGRGGAVAPPPTPPAKASGAAASSVSAVGVGSPIVPAPSMPAESKPSSDPTGSSGESPIGRTPPAESSLVAAAGRAVSGGTGAVARTGNDLSKPGAPVAGGGTMFLVGGGVFLGVACGLAFLWLRGQRSTRRGSSVISRSMERDSH